MHSHLLLTKFYCENLMLVWLRSQLKSLPDNSEVMRMDIMNMQKVTTIYRCMM